MFSQFQSKLLTLISALNPFLQSKWPIKFIMIHKELGKIAISKAPNSFHEFCCSVILESSSEFMRFVPTKFIIIAFSV